MSYASLSTYDNPGGVDRSSTSTYLDVTRLENLYRELGAMSGWAAGPHGRQKLREQFAAYGHQAVEWLLARMRTERSEDTLRGATELLSELLDRRTWTLIADALMAHADADDRAARPVFETLLRSLGRRRVPMALESRAEHLIRRFAASRSATLRELAVRIIGGLRNREPLLAELAADPDPDVQETLAEVRALPVDE